MIALSAVYPSFNGIPPANGETDAINLEITPIVAVELFPEGFLMATFNFLHLQTLPCQLLTRKA